MTHVVCPCCGSHIEIDAPLIDLNTNTVVFHGNMMHSTAQVIDLLYILRRSFPASVSDDELIRGMHGRVPPRSAMRVLRTTVHKARKIGRDLGFDIENNYARGYRMVVQQQEKEDV